MHYYLTRRNSHCAIAGAARQVQNFKLKSSHWPLAKKYSRLIVLKAFVVIVVCEKMIFDAEYYYYFGGLQL